MLRIPGGTFLMGSDSHYAEERPAHRVRVDAFWMDRTPVTNREFRRFVEATGHVTNAERPPDPRDYPGALPHMLKAGSLVFTPQPDATPIGQYWSPYADGGQYGGGEIGAWFCAAWNGWPWCG